MPPSPRRLVTPAEKEQFTATARRTAELFRGLMNSLRDLARTAREVMRRTAKALAKLATLTGPAPDPLRASALQRPAWQSPFGPPIRRRSRR